MKRRLRTLLVFLLLGALINIAVAWGLLFVRHDAWRFDDGRDVYGYWPAHEPQLDVLTESGTGVQAVGAITIEYQEERELILEKSQYGAGPAAVPRWSSIRSQPLDALGTDEYSSDVAWGWPLLALHSYLEYAFVPVDASERDLAMKVSKAWGAVPGFMMGSSEEQYAIPFLPIWPGFAINTVFYAVILWMLFAAPFALRRRSRIKRGLCPKCAYDLRGRGSTSHTCPECGASVTAR